MSYNKHEVWRNRLFDALNEEPAPGDVAPTVADILKADEKIWLLLESETRDGIQPKSSVRPLETALDEILKRYEVTSRLICKQSVNARASTPSSEKGTPPPGSSSQDKKDRRIVQQEAQLNNLKRKLGGGSDSGQARPGKKGKGKGKGKKGKGKRRYGRVIRMPKPLVGLSPTDENGEPFCFDAALGKCNLAKWGEKCPRGWHKCMSPGCKQNHASVANH